MHKAKACVVTCIDFRFQEQIHEFLKTKHLENSVDLISVAGCSRDFIVPIDPIDEKYVWKELELSVKLHDPDEIIFIDHQDCGGYAQDGTIPGGLDVEEDRNRHIEQLKSLKKKLEGSYPEKSFNFFHADLNGGVTELEI